MATMKISMRGALWGTALLGLAGCLLAAAPAQAQWHNERIEKVCGWIPDTAQQAYDSFEPELLQEFGADGFHNEAFCSKLTKNFIKGCNTALKDRVKCWEDQNTAVNKQNSTACKELFNRGVEASDCVNHYNMDAKEDSATTKAAGKDEIQECETITAATYFYVCMNGD